MRRHPHLEDVGDLGFSRIDEARDETHRIRSGFGHQEERCLRVGRLRYTVGPVLLRPGAFAFEGAAKCVWRVNE